jgi:type IV secretion system protein VirD4
MSSGLNDFRYEFYRLRSWYRFWFNLGRSWRASNERKKIEGAYGAAVADAVEAAIKAGRNPKAILEQAEKARQEQAERERLLTNPPPLHGSAAWATPDELAGVLRGREAFDAPSSLLFGAYLEEGQSDPTGFVHWDGDGHILTVAPTRSGKAVTTIIPNLLRYRGSAVVLDPKGELYATTSKWRAENVGLVYRLAPFDNGSDPRTFAFPRHGFNPLTRVRSQADARSLAQLMFPRDPHAPEFFTEDAVAFMTALILFIQDTAPPERQTLSAVRRASSLPTNEFMGLARRMASSRLASVAEAAHNALGKSGDRGIPNLRDTLHSKLAMWSDDAIRACVSRHDVDFEGLKERPATVYIDVPFDLVKPYAPWLRVVLKSALDAMLRNPTVPRIPVLFVLDEFAALGRFEEFRDAIRTHAGAGVRLWFFLQDLAALEESYPHGTWKPFLNCSVKQFFGIDDPFTAELIGKYLGTTTVAQRMTNASVNISAAPGGDLFGRGGSANLSLSSNEGIQLSARPLMTPDEVMGLLSDWQGDGWRSSILQMRGKRPFQPLLVAWNRSPVCRSRVGAFITSRGKLAHG